MLQKEGQTLDEDVNFIFVNEDHLLAINKDYLDHDYHTDVIGFQYQDNVVAGDIYISIDYVKSFSEENNLDANAEIARTIIHGFLHFLGYKDKTDLEKSLMTKKENEYLNLHPLL